MSSKYPGAPGASSTEETHSKAAAGGSVSGSSRGPLSIDLPHRFWSVLKTDFFGLMSIPCVFAYWISMSLVMFHSRTGAITLMPGLRERTVTSILTWSLPFPVQP